MAKAWIAHTLVGSSAGMAAIGATEIRILAYVLLRMYYGMNEQWHHQKLNPFTNETTMKDIYAYKIHGIIYFKSSESIDYLDNYLSDYSSKEVNLSRFSDLTFSR